MSALLDEPRIAYTSRKVQRLREDVKTWGGERGVWDDLVRDVNLAGRDLLEFDRVNTEVFATPADPASRAVQILTSYRNLIAAWADLAAEILRIGSTTAQDAGETAGLAELRGHLEAAKKIAAANPAERLFRELVRAWEKDTYFLSSTTQIVSHTAFQRIVDLGDVVVPLLLAEVRARPSHLIVALKRITGADPVPPEDRGKLRAMADAWVKWGEARQLV